MSDAAHPSVHVSLSFTLFTWSDGRRTLELRGQLDGEDQAQLDELWLRTVDAGDQQQAECRFWKARDRFTEQLATQLGVTLF